MIRGRSTLEFRKIAQERRTIVMALFWVELHAKHISILNRTSKLEAIIAKRRSISLITALKKVRMQEIEARIVFESFKQRQGRTANRSHIIPTHMRHR